MICNFNITVIIIHTSIYLQYQISNMSSKSDIAVYYHYHYMHIATITTTATATNSYCNHFHLYFYYYSPCMRAENRLYPTITHKVQMSKQYCGCRKKNVKNETVRNNKTKNKVKYDNIQGIRDLKKLVKSSKKKVQKILQTTAIT